MRICLRFTIILLMLFSPLVFAHSVYGEGGFMSGLRHPVLGFDHLLAMLSVGVLSAQMGGKSIWTVPTTFVGVMLVGGILGMQGIHIMSVEIGIACSVLALGIAIASSKKMPPFIAMIFVGFFAIFHGHAHGSEIPYLVKPELYACGFVVGTAGIHIVGVIIGLVSKKLKNGAEILRYVGAGVAGIGVHLLIM